MANEKALESGPLESLFSGNATAKILDFLVAFQAFDYSETDIAKSAGVSVRTVQRELPKLESFKLVTSSRRVGKAKMYKLNKTWKTGYYVEKFALALASSEIEKMLPADIKREKKEVREIAKYRILGVNPTFDIVDLADLEND